MENSHPLQSKPFLIFWISQTTSQIANAIYLLALPLWVFSLTGSSFFTGVTIFLQTFTMMIFSPLMGVVIDNFNKKTLLIMSDFIRGALILLLLFVDSSEKMYIVYIVTFLTGILNTLFNPARIAFVRCLIKKEILPKANSLLMLGLSISMIIGPIIGGGVVSVLTYNDAFIINSASFFIGALGTILTNVKLDKNNKLSPKFSVITGQIKEGFLTIVKNNTLKTINLFQFIVFFGTGANSVLFILVLNTNNVNSQSIGYFMAAQGIGMAVTSLLLPLLKPEKNILLFITIFSIIMGMTVSLFILSSIKYFFLGVIFIICNGLVTAAFNIMVQTATQTFSSKDMLGRIASTSQLIMRGAMALSTLIFSAIAEIINPIILVITGGLIIIIGSVFLYYNLRKIEVRKELNISK
ncbi:MFS transporter [Bacillus cereus]|uniref:MFS transporter n=1 Tax=Bacillus cereus TaxID=1396 RepID=UPI0009C455D0|nr:MFS transporter [Bacillus cereus]OOQ93159.1 hypothetical protein BW898_20505 [Bacillus cereus]